MTLSELFPLKRAAAASAMDNNNKLKDAKMLCSYEEN